MVEKKNWHEAQDFCKVIGGDLISIHSWEDLNNSPYVTFVYIYVYIYIYLRILYYILELK